MNSLFMAATQRSGLWHIHVQVELLTWKSIKDLTSDGGVIKTVLEEGSGWNKPADKDEALGEPSHRPDALCPGPLVHISANWEPGRLLPALQGVFVSCSMVCNSCSPHLGSAIVN